MKVLFCHDGPIRRDENNVFYGGAHNDRMFKRYFEIASKLDVAMRVKDIHSVDANEKLSEITNENISFIEIPNLNSLRNIKKHKKIRKEIESLVSNSDYIVARLPSTIGSLAVKSAKKLNKPYLIEVVGCSWDALINHGSITGKLLAPLAYLNQKKDIKNSNNTIYITKEFLQRRYPTKGNYEVIPNVIIEPVSERVLNERVKRIDKLTSPIKFGLVGSLNVEYKGHETLLKALSLIKNKLPKFKIEFLGEGSEERWISRISGLGLLDNVEFIGTLESGNAVFNWMDNIDIAIQPSLAEAQGRSIIEFMSRGCPVIATDVGGIGELIEKELLAQPNDYVEISELILNLLDKRNMKNQAIRNFQEATNYYEPSINSKRSEYFREFKLNND